MIILSGVTVTYYLISSLKEERASGSVGFGYDGKGKYIRISPEPSKVLINDVEQIPSEKIYYNWLSGRGYKFYIEFKQGGKLEKSLIAPYIQPSLEVTAQRIEGATVVEIKAIEVDKVILHPVAKELGPEAAITIPDYPTLGINTGEFSALRRELRRAFSSLGYRITRIPTKGGIVIVANGAFPKELNLLKRAEKGELTVVFIGSNPEFCIDKKGVVTKSSVEFAVFKAESEVKDEVFRMKTSLWYPSVTEKVLAERKDNAPAVFYYKGIYYFTGFYENPSDAVSDVLKVLFAGGESQEVELNKDSKALTKILKGNFSGIVVEKVINKRSTYSFVRAAESGAKGSIEYSADDCRVRAIVEEGKEGEVSLYFISDESYESEKIELGRKEKGVFLAEKGFIPTGSGYLLLKLGDQVAAVERVEAEPIRAIFRKTRDGYLIEIRKGEELYKGKITVAKGERKKEFEVEGYLKSREDVDIFISGVKIPKTFEEKKSNYLSYALVFVILSMLLLVRRVSKKEEQAVFIKFLDPMPKMKTVKISPEDIEEAIEKYVGKNIRPLTIEEIRRAIELYKSGGTTLDEIKDVVEKALKYKDSNIVKYANFYGLRKWEKELSQSFEHLAMVRAAYEYLIRNGYQARAYYKTLSQVPDVIGFSPKEVVAVECETGKKYHGYLKSLLKKAVKYSVTIEYSPMLNIKRPFNARLIVVVPDELYEEYQRFIKSISFDEWKYQKVFIEQVKSGRLTIMPFSQLFT